MGLVNRDSAEQMGLDDGRADGRMGAGWDPRPAGNEQLQPAYLGGYKIGYDAGRQERQGRTEGAGTAG